jgi:hypothetical protein
MAQTAICSSCVALLVAPVVAILPMQPLALEDQEAMLAMKEVMGCLPTPCHVLQHLHTLNCIEAKLAKTGA